MRVGYVSWNGFQALRRFITRGLKTRLMTWRILSARPCRKYCLTQFNSASLNRHLSQAYNSNVGTYNRTGFVEVLAAQQSPKNKVGR